MREDRRWKFASGFQLIAPVTFLIGSIVIGCRDAEGLHTDTKEFPLCGARAHETEQAIGGKFERVQQTISEHSRGSRKV